MDRRHPHTSKAYVFIVFHFIHLAPSLLSQHILALILLFFFHIIYFALWECVPPCMWKPEDSLGKPAVLYFDHSGPRDGAQVFGFGGKHLYQLSRLAGLLGESTLTPAPVFSFRRFQQPLPPCSRRHPVFSSSSSCSSLEQLCAGDVTWSSVPQQSPLTETHTERVRNSVPGPHRKS